MSSEEARVRNISHIHMNCHDFKVSVAFYELLGFKVDRIIGNDPDNPSDLNDMDTVPLNRTEMGASYTVGMGLGTDPRTITRLEFIQTVEPSPKVKVKIPPNDRLGMVRIAFTVAGLDEIMARVKEAGVEIDSIEHFDISPTLSARYCHLYDPDGNWLTLMEWIKHKKPE